MCGPESQMSLDIDEIPWRTYQCQDCGNTFKMMSKTPRCPKCRSDNLIVP